MNHLQSDIHNISLRKALLFAYQRAVRGYDDRISQGWGFVDYLDVLLEPLKEFCEKEIQNINYWTKNGLPPTSREQILSKTIKLINEYRTVNVNSIEYDEKEKEMWKLISDNIGAYWN